MARCIEYRLYSDHSVDIYALVNSLGPSLVCVIHCVHRSLSVCLDLKDWLQLKHGYSRRGVV
jgi:hypothetical protein